MRCWVSITWCLRHVYKPFLLFSSGTRTWKGHKFFMRNWRDWKKWARAWAPALVNHSPLSLPHPQHTNLCMAFSYCAALIFCSPPQELILGKWVDYLGGAWTQGRIDLQKAADCILASLNLSTILLEEKVLYRTLKGSISAMYLEPLKGSIHS